MGFLASRITNLLTIKIKKCNQLNEKYQGDIKIWYRKGKYLQKIANNNEKQLKINF